MSGHTPGPWRISMLHEQGLYGAAGEITISAGDIDGDDYANIADVKCHAKVKRGEAYRAKCPTRDANARLTAAAPTLLEVAVALDAYWGEDYPPPGEIGEKRKDDLHFTTLAIWRQIRAAIALATGAA